MKRRQFLRLASLATASLPFSKNANAARGVFLPKGSAKPNDGVFYQFASPENRYRPFVRWWWNGDRVQAEESLRELDVMQAAGIGGVEINPIKWNQNADPIGIPDLSWGSKEWLKVVSATVKGARERRMTCDMIVGSGWPYGGEFVPIEEQAQIVILGTRNLAGGANYSIPRQELLDSVKPPSNREGSTKELFCLRLAPAVMDSFNPGTRLDDQLQRATIDVSVPDGDHLLYYLVKVTGYQSVLQGAPGAGGPTINHYDEKAVEHYLNHFSDVLSSEIGPLNKYFRAFFTDSIELEGANWCNDMFQQFKSLRGYDLEPYFPYILFKVGGMGNRVSGTYGTKFSPGVQEMLNRVHYDFEVTRLDLFKERFMGTFTRWCANIGVKSRMQAYGMDCYAIEDSMMLDIPECETWIWGPEIDEFSSSLHGLKGRNYSMVNKFVSSAAHLAGKQLISCEEMTNTSRIFDSTLERIKLTGDQSNLSGVTHSILHGFNYSPKQAPFPGWVQYGSFFNERNTWWPYFRMWADYKARMSCLFQNSVMQADIAVLHPFADLASKFGVQRDPFPAVSYPSYVHQVWEAIHQCGNGCDYVSETILQQAVKSKDGLVFGPRKYTTLILVEVETMQPQTAQAIREFADNGGKVIFVAKAPHESAGLVDHDAKSQVIQDQTHAVLKHIRATGVVEAPTTDVLSWYRKVQQEFSLAPYIQISDPVIHVSQLHYKAESKDIFYFTNYSAEKSHSFRANFPDKTKIPWLWDTETGKRYLYPVDTEGQLHVSLGPSESRLIVFEGIGIKPASGNPEMYTPVTLEHGVETEVQGPWDLTLKSVAGPLMKLSLEQLGDLKLRPDTKDFSGTISYSRQVKWERTKGKVYLSLGHINDISELEINGRLIGTRWYGNHIYDITDAIQTGSNDVRIKVVTTLGAYARTLKENKAAQDWIRNSPPFGPTGLVNPVKLIVL